MKRKKVLSLVLALLLCFPAVPVNAIAGEVSEPVTNMEESLQIDSEVEELTEMQVTEEGQETESITVETDADVESAALEEEQTEEQESVLEETTVEENETETEEVMTAETLVDIAESESIETEVTETEEEILLMAQNSLGKKRKYNQYSDEWPSYYQKRGCILFSFANAIYCLNGQEVDIIELGKWAINANAWTGPKEGGGYRDNFYPAVEKKFGSTYGFKIGTKKYAGVDNKELKKHLQNNGVVAAHVKNHFTALVDYNPSKDEYYVVDSAKYGGLPAAGWVSSDKLSTGKTTVDWFVFISSTGVLHSPTVSSWSVTSTDNNKVSISLKWNKVSGATSYRIDRRPKGGEYSTIKTGVTATSYTDSGLQDGKTYYYRVYAVNSSGTSKEKNTCGCIGKPTISSWTANGTTSVTINWDDKGADATYTIQRRPKIAGATSEYQTIKTGVTGTSFKDTGLAAGTIYYYKVKGVNNTGSSLKSDSCRVWTKSNAPAVRALSATSVQVSWSAVQFAGTYTLKRCLASDTSKWTTVKTGITGTSFTDTGLSPNTAYRYQIWPVGPANIDYITVQSNTSDPVTTKKGYYLDLNGYLDMNTNAGTIKDYGTVDVYINGRCVADDVGDYYQVVDDGATYEFKDIKAAAGKYYYGVSRGALKGTISGSAQTTVLHFGTMCQGGTKVLPEGKYVILSALDRTKCLDVADGGKTNGTNLQLWTYTGETSQAFALKYHPEGYYSLTDVNSGLYVNVEGSGSVNRTNLHLWDAENEKDAQWVIRESGDGYYHLITYRSSMYMDVTGAVSADGTNIQIYKGNGNAAQKFAFVPYEYTVGYDANGGTGAPAEQTKVYEKSLTLSETKPTREGYTFLGWAVDETGSVSYQPGAAYTDNAAVTLYAVWEKEETFTEGAVKVGSFSASAGEEISLPVMISDNPGLVSAEFSVGYDSSVLEWTGIEKGDFSGTLDGRPGTSITWFAEDPKTNETKSGTIVVLQFKVKDGIADTKTEVTVTYAADNVYNADEENVALKVVPGTVTIASYLPGDINGDGTVNNKDVTRLMRYVKYNDVEVVTAALDVNGDGTVNNKDVTRLMRYVKYKDVEIH